MSQDYIEGPTRTFPSNSALAKGIRVVLTAGYLVAAASTEVELGTMENATLSGDKLGTVRLRTASGTATFVASGAITAGNPFYAAASGKVASSGTVYCGTALETTTANNDQLEGLRGPNTDLSAAIAGTTASSFEVDNDATTPSIALASQTGGTGDFAATIKPPATLTAARVFTLDGDANATIANVGGAQTLTSKTLTSPVLNTPTVNVDVAAVAAAGSIQGDATAITVKSGGFVHGTGADATKGIQLPPAAAGYLLFVKNSDAANAVLKVWPATGDAINALSANAAISMAAKTSAVFVAIDATTWYTIPLLPS